MTEVRSLRRRVTLAVAGAAIIGGALIVAGPLLAESGEGRNDWWDPGSGDTLPARALYDDPYGRVAVLSADGSVDTAGHPFFEPIGSNGRACVSCHQPANAMSLSVATIRERWEETGGRDPIFAAIDGMNCPHLPPEDPASHSLLLDRGLFRVFLPWPPTGPDGDTVEPQFDIEVVRDPTGCNTHPEYGLESDSPTISVYRRPRPAANLRYVTSTGFGVSRFNIKNGQPNAVDPLTGKPVNMNMMADAREPTLRTQAASAAAIHLQRAEPLGEEDLARIEAFELQLYAAQEEHDQAGDLGAEGGPSGLGVDAMAEGRDGVLGNNVTAYVFPIEDVWRDIPRTGDPTHDEEAEFRESVARGHDVFFFRTFWISDAMHINSVGLGNPIKRTCSTCHGMHMTGMDTANGWMDLGTTNRPWAMEPPISPWADEKPELPLFKLTCRDDSPPHPFLGRVIYTQDPGRALISGRCDDIGSIVIQQMRGLAARAPYFSNGSAASLEELVDFYDRRFNIQYTEQERRDLAAFLSTL
jgi:hypothetical protein